MAQKKPRPAKRGPYKVQSDVEDPDQLGKGGIRIRQHRLARAWTVEKLALEAKLSQGTISGIESGSSGYSPTTLQKLAKAFGTTVGALFDVDPRRGHGAEFWPIWNRAKPQEQQRIIDYSKGVVGEK